MNFLDFIFPKTCLSCGRWGRYICDRCKQSFVPIEKDACVYCDKISQFGHIHDSCKRMNDIDGYFGIWYLTPHLQRTIKKIKYKLVTDAFRALCHTVPEERLFAIQDFASHYRACSIQSIPLHPQRYNKRGFNQADLISQFLHEGTGYPIINALRRVKDTSPQAQTISRMERHYNMQKAFAVNDTNTIKGKSIILVDDIYTTGNTIRKAARVCKMAGADKVYAFTLAKG